MTPDEATLAAGKILERWPNCRIAFDAWEEAFLEFDTDSVHRAIAHVARNGTTVADLTISLVLSARSAPAPRPAPPSAPQRTTIVPPANTDPDERMLSEDARAAGLNRVAWLRGLIDDARAQRTPTTLPDEPTPATHAEAVKAGLAWDQPADPTDSTGINDEPATAGGVAA